MLIRLKVVLETPFEYESVGILICQKDPDIHTLWNGVEAINSHDQKKYTKYTDSINNNFKKNYMSSSK